MLLEKLLGVDAGAVLAARLRSGTSLAGRARIVELAARVRRHRLRRRELFPQPIFGEPPWEMMIALYLDFPDGTTISSLASSVGLAGTTVRRWLGYLKDHRMVKTVPWGHDRRSVCVLLTDDAREKLDRYFSDRAGLIRLPRARRGAVRLSPGGVVHQVALELLADEGCTVGALADQANASARQWLDRGDANLLRQAAAHHRALVER